MTSTYRLAALTLFGVLFVLPVLLIISGPLIAGAAAGGLLSSAGSGDAGRGVADRPTVWAPGGAASSHGVKIAVYENGLMSAGGLAKVEYVSDYCPTAAG